MTLEAVRSAIRHAIADESRLTEPYHRGRVSALQFVLDLMADDKMSSYSAEKSSSAAAKNAASAIIAPSNRSLTTRRAEAVLTRSGGAFELDGVQVQPTPESAV